MIEPSSPKVRRANLRRSKVTTVTGFSPGDRLMAAWDAKKQSWKLIVESANGLLIAHSDLTSGVRSA
jgi:hypothetical protein